MRNNQPQGIILGSGITVLGVLRCLAPRGVPVVVVPSARACCRRSRYFRLAPPFDGRDFVAYLADLEPASAVLIPCSDHWAQEAANLPPEVAHRFPAVTPSAEVLGKFVDKGAFRGLLEERGVPHPRTIPVDDDYDLGGLDPSDGLFIKPRDSQEFHHRFGVKAFWPDSKDDLLGRLEEVRREGLEVVLQEYVPGPASNHYFVDGFIDRDGKIRGQLVRQRLRMHPPRFGNSSFMVSVDPREAEGAVSTVNALLAEGDYRGLFSAEFKKDERDGVFKILEVNARPWWFVEFAATCGLNLVEMAYQDAAGLPITGTSDYQVGKYLVHPYYDVSACLREFPTRAKGLVQFVRSIPGADQPVWRWRDPGPAFCELADLSRKFVTRRLRRLRGK